MSTILGYTFIGSVIIGFLACAFSGIFISWVGAKTNEELGE